MMQMSLENPVHIYIYIHTVHRLQNTVRSFSSKQTLPTDLPTFQAHGAGVLYLGLLSTAVPMILVAYCWSRIPRLSDVELVGGTYFPSISVRCGFDN